MLTNDKARELFLSESKFQTPTEELAKALNMASDFVGDMGAEITNITPRRKPHWLTLAGASGCGKTMLAKEIVRFAERHMSYNRELCTCNEIVFKTILDLADDWRAGKWRNETDETAWLMVIDDLGRERDFTGFIIDRLAGLLERRLGRWTVITTNLKYESIRDNYDARIASRLIRDGNKRMGFKSSADWWLRKGNL